MSSGKVIRFDYDWISSKDDDEEYSICLTWAERQILLTMIDYIGWEKRWVSPTQQEIDFSQIIQWRNGIVEELITECPVNCTEVVACIVAALDGDESTLYDELLDWFQRHQSELEPPEDGVGTIPASGENLNTGGCDNPAMFGFAKQLVQLANRNIEDFFEVIEAITSVVELAQALSDSVPVLSTLTDLAEYIRDNTITAYQSNYDQELEDNIACDIFCLMTANDSCTITWDEILDYLSLKLSYTLGDVSLSDWATFVILGTWDGDEWVYMAFWLFFAVLSIGGDWTGVTLEWIQRALAAFYNDPDEDWETLCTNCVWVYEIDFTTEQGDWALAEDFNAVNQGVYVASTGWQTTAQNNATGGGNDWSRAICISHALSSADSVINTITVTYNYTNSGNWDGSGNTHHAFLRTPSDILKQVSSESDPTGSGKGLQNTGDWEIDATQDELVLRFLSGRWFSSGDPGGQVTITGIQVSGVGDNPFD